MSGPEYEHEWLPDEGWTADEDIIAGKQCSQRACHEAAVASFFRKVFRRDTGTSHQRRWYCCNDREHMYGRRVTDGVVEFPFMVGSQSWARAKRVEEASR